MPQYLQTKNWKDVFYVLRCLDWCMILVGMVLVCVVGCIMPVFYVLFTASIKVEIMLFNF